MVKPAHLDFTEKLVRHLMWEVLEKDGFTAEDLAAKVGGAARTYKNYKYGSGTPSLSIFLGIIRACRPVELMKELAAQCGGYFIHIPNSFRNNEALTRHTAVIMKETSDVIQAVASALEDGIVSEGEASMINRQATEAIEALLRLQTYLEEKEK